MVKLTRDAILELDTRRKVYTIITESPGIHFRELQRRAGMAYGALQYHLEFLLRYSLIIEEKGREYSRFFLAGFKSMREREFISLLRQKSIRGILVYLLENPGSRNKSIVAELGLSPSTVSWHVGRLVRAGAVVHEKKEGESLFYVSEPETVTRLLVTYKSSYLDTLVDRFVDVWERENPKNP